MPKESLEEQSEPNNPIPAIEPLPKVKTGMPDPEQVASLVPIVEETAEKAVPSERRHIVKSATLVMLGNLGSSSMGMVRQIVVAALGSSVAGPFTSAISPAQTFNDLLINGSINGALIPTFNDYAAPEKREELRRVVFTIVNLVLIIMAVAAIIFLFIAPWFVATIQVPGYTAQEKMLTTQFARIIFFSLLALGPFAVLQAALFARKEFGWPAVATASYHVGIILGAIVGGLLGARYNDYLGLAIGVIIGAFGE
ncbi:MAG TPA: lipid II flippase MurJ, partial [Ktedonobacteraceae bacterium]|nr:lipid II flippase MurJ [Ktedonobacteraceae bacterium]